MKRSKITGYNFKDTPKILLQPSVVTFDNIQNEIKNWKNKKSSVNRLLEYQMKNGILYLIEPDNEFTMMMK